MSYQGHLADGSSIQKHSVGSIYPYIIYAKQHGEKLAYGVLEPRGREALFANHEQATSFALACKARKEAKGFAQRNEAQAAINLLLTGAL